MWPVGKPSEDLDQDGISDAYERQIADRFKPIFHLNKDGVYRPASVKFFVEQSALQTPEGAKAPASISEVLKSIAGKDSQTFRLEPRPRFDPEHSDAEAKQEKVTVFYRVFRPDGGTFVFKPESGCEYLAIQYYFFCFFSDADFPANAGDHDGDWECMDLSLIVKAPPGHPAAAATYDIPIVHSAVFHNHGRELFADSIHHKKLDLDKSLRLNVYLENNANEPWPNAGGSGFGGWPAAPGFLANKRFEKSTGIDFPWSPREDRIAREHQAGPPVSDYELQNLGERDHPMPQDVARFVMTYAGKYGNYAPNVDKYAPVLKVLDIPRNDPPEGPRFQAKMWDRKFEGAALPFQGEDAWLEWKGGEAPVKTESPPK